MIQLTIDDQQVQVEDGTTILAAAAKVGIDIPTLCFLKDINETGVCRVCVVEVEGQERLVASCNNVAEDGMVIHTNSPKVRSARRTNMQLMLSEHRSECTTCIRNGNCSLQSLAADLGIIDMPYDVEYDVRPWNMEAPIIRDASKCINCLRCVQVCDKIQDLGIWSFKGTGTHTHVEVAEGLPIDQVACTYCGQCITHCPVGALSERDDTAKVLRALADPDKIVLVQIAPAVRTAWAESLGLSRDEATVKRLVAALRKIGFDYIFDTNFSADLTIMEEGSEFIQRLGNAENEAFPMFTSCCPGWVRFLKSQYPDMVHQLSTAKSPQQMFGAVAKTYYAELLGIDPNKIFSVSIMPCSSKKHESALDALDDSGAGKDVDVVLTTREVARLIKAEHIAVDKLEEEEFDTPLGVGTGAAVIFGTTGGVMEAALRSAHFLIMGENPEPDAFKAVRGMEGWKEATFSLPGKDLKVAVVSGLANTRKLIEALRAGEVEYDFVEVMACPGGCAGGGGQPITDGVELADVRAQKLYGLDAKSDIRFSHENPSVMKCYEDYFGAPLSEKSHHLLHTDHTAWKMPGEK